MSCNSMASDMTNAVKTTTMETSDILSLVRASTLYGITFSNFQIALGVTGSINPVGSPTATQLLNQPAPGVNFIRSLDPSQGISVTVDAYGGISLKTDLVNAGSGTDGAQVIVDQTADQLVFKRIKAGAGVSVSETATSVLVASTAEVSLLNQVIVRSSADLLGTLDSTKSYFIDGQIDMSGVSIVVPATGLTLDGYGFGVSGLYCADNTYTMFTTSGAGNVFISKTDISVTGTNSKVYELFGASGNEAIETNYVNYNNCTSLGELAAFRQGLEFNTGRFGGSPSLTLDGVWLGGYRIDVSIAIPDASMTLPLFRVGSDFEIRTRMLMNINANLRASAILFDFIPANFTSTGALQLNDCVIQRDGVFDTSDTTITPNINQSNIECRWVDNKGIRNTNTGGRIDLTASALTTIATIDTYVDVAGTFTASQLEHYDSPANGRLRNLSGEPQDYRIDVSMSVVGTANELLTLAIVKYDASLLANVIISTQQRRVNSVSGPNDTAFFNMIVTTEMNSNDYVFLQIKNITSTNNCTADVDSIMIAGER